MTRSTEPADLWRQALDLHGQGRLAEAAEVYSALLSADPGFSPALAGRGAARLSLGQAEAAAADLEARLRAEPQDAEAHSNLGVALSRLGRHHDALACFGRAVGLKPDFGDAHNNAADALLALARLAEAQAAAESALKLEPRNAAAWHNRGRAQLGLKQSSDALQSLEAALRLDPRLAHAHFHRGLALIGLERPLEALAAFDQALVLAPDLVEARYNRAHLLYGQGRHAEALEGFRAVLEAAPTLTQAEHNLGRCLQALGRYEEALAAYDRARTRDPHLTESHTNAGLMLSQQERFAEALAAYELAGEAGDRATADNNRALIHLVQGQFEAGWRLMESRFAMPEWAGRRDPAGPRWRGEDLAGRTLFVHWEQGLGDTLQFCRYLPLARDRGARVVFAGQDGLRHLLTGLGEGIEIIGQNETPAAYDFHIPLLSLPLAFATTEETVPARSAWLAADPDRIARWRERLGPGGLKIGVAWRGSAFGAKRGYSYALADLAPLAALPGARLISLQKEDRGEAAPFALERPGADFDIGPDAFADTAAIMASLDLVVTPDTAIAHLAGVLGRPSWVALRKAADWRWLLHREDSPWYPSLRLFRQSRMDDWSGVFAAMAAELQAGRPRI